MSKNEELAQNWRKQAVLDLRAARSNMESGNNEWACFAAQQAAEKFLKAFLYAQGQRVLTSHSLRRLVLEAADHDENFASLEKEAKTLDRFYFATRYPDAIAGEVPGEYFSDVDAKEAIVLAERFENAVQVVLKG